MMDTDTPRQMLDAWRGSLPSVTRGGSGTYYGALVLLDRIRQQSALDLSAQDLFTDNGARVSGLNPTSVRKVLSAAAPDLQVNAIAGRTSPGVAAAGKLLLERLKQAGIERISREDQLGVLDACVVVVCEYIRGFQEQERFEFPYDRTKALPTVITDLLAQYAGSPRVRALAQHLVGAKLELRYPELSIGRESVDAADAPGGRDGDFQINDFVFHVTVSPGLPHVVKCVANLRKHLWPTMIVPDSAVGDVRVYAKNYPSDLSRIRVRSIEDFLSQNIEELAVFNFQAMEQKLAELLGCYNSRVREAEQGKPFLEITCASLGIS